MRVRALLTSLLCAAVLLACSWDVAACTSLLVTKGASVDGSVMITYTCDGEFHPTLEHVPAADHAPDATVDIGARGSIPQVAHTYAVVDLMNEHQVAIGETTFDGRAELQNPEGMLHYWDLMKLALQRSKTAREAIEVITSLVADHGYRSTGESFSIADANEAWILEMIGPGPGGDGAIWVAMRIPDGCIAAHANKARIGTFPLDDPDNCLYSENVISFAIERGYYDPSSGEPFSFCEAYCPATARNLRWAEGRVWSLFRRAAPSLGLEPDYFRGVEDAERYPLWIKPDRKIGVGDVFDLMRDHFEGTEFDMTEGVDAGPYGSPYRWRPLGWEVDGEAFGWERAISTQQTGFSFVSQSRSWLPDSIGGVYWYGVDDTWFTCYTPLYCGIDDIPRSFATHHGAAFSFESAWWTFNLVANLTMARYSVIIPEVQAAQRDLEQTALRLQPAIEQTALTLYKEDPELMRRYLTDHCVATGELTVARWRDLAKYLITRHNDGYRRDDRGRPRDVGYRDAWLRRVIESRGDTLSLPPEEE